MFQQDPTTQLSAMTCAELHQLLGDGAPVRLVDVRTPYEREICTIEPSVLLDSQETAEALLAADDGTPVVLFCHHGGRSYSAALWLAQRGLRTVYNLEGGIDAWSREVDPTVPRY